MAEMAAFNSSTGRTIENTKKTMLGWPQGGLGIFVSTTTCNSELAASHHIAEPLCLSIHDHSVNFVEVLSFQH